MALGIGLYYKHLGIKVAYLFIKYLFAFLFYINFYGV